MPTFRSSTSVRLAFGFGVVLCVLGSALLVNIYYLEKLKDASEQVRGRQQIQREALRVARMGEKAYQALMSGGELDMNSFAQFDIAYSRLAATVQGLGSQHVDHMEWLDLNRFTQVAGRLREGFHTVHEIAAEPDIDVRATRIAELSATTGERMVSLIELRKRLDQGFDLSTYRVEDQAEQIWQLSLAIARMIFGVALAVSLLAVFLTHRAIVHPIRNLVTEIKTLATGDLSSRMEVPHGGEFRVLAEGLNRMAEALESNRKQLIEAEKLATIGRFSAGIAHEINNPIAVILGYVKTLMTRLPPDSPHLDALKAVEEETHHCRDIVRGLLDLARPATTLESEIINPNEIVQEVVNLAGMLQLTAHVRIRVTVIDEAVSVPFGHTRLRQIVLNIVSNALEALKQIEDGELTIEGHLQRGPEGPHGVPLHEAQSAGQFLVFRFTDNGPGIPEEDRQRVFEPFFTTRPGGTGLGLAITNSIVDALGGHIDVASAVGHGTTFVLSLPTEASAGGPAGTSR